MFDYDCYSNEYLNPSIRIWDSIHSRSFGAHWHHPLEIILPTNNYYDISSYGHHYHILEGEILIIPARFIHTVDAPATGSRFIFQFNDSCLTRIQGYAQIMSLMTACLHITKTSHPHIYDKICLLLFEIKDEYSDMPKFHDLTIYAKLIEIFLLIGDDLHQKTETPVFTNIRKQEEYIRKFNDVLSYIDINYAKDLTLETVASYSGFSKYYFSRLFKQYTDFTFYEYLCLRRIKAAEELLCYSAAPVTEIALLSGFSSISSFNRIFKQQKNCTPREYRASHTVTNELFHENINCADKGITEHLPKT